jgi:hypothetical protein
MVATVYEEESLLQHNEVEQISESELGEQVQQQEVASENSESTQTESETVVAAAPISEKFVDVTKATKGISLAFGGFVGSLLAVDIWYSRKKGIRKFTGQTLAHLTFIIAAVVSIWFVLTPGLVI